MGSRGFWRELKRRHVYRVAVAYAIIGWLLIQVVTQVFPVFHLPDWIDQAVVLLILIGFPIALVLAWAFDATPHGIVRTDAVPDAADNAAMSSRRSRRAGAAVGLIGVVFALVAGGAYWHFGDGRSMPRRHAVAVSMPAAPNAQGSSIVLGGATPQTPDANTPMVAIQAIPAKSIAVLPFVNMSGDPKNDYFSDGITEEILDALAQVPDLKVAARTSAFAFKGKAEDLRKVGEALGVATVLEGSVQKSGDEVRITAQLIDTRTGYHLWSEKYDRKLTSIFAVEDEISKAIADKLKLQLAGDNGQSLVAQRAIDPHAHDYYLRGLALLGARAHLRDAVSNFQQALAIAPDDAQAWAKLAQTDMLLPWYEHASVKAAVADAQIAVDHALALAPDNAAAWGALGMIDHMRWQWADADKAFRRALQLAPGDAEIINQYAQFLSSAGQFDKALSEFRRAQTLDPLSPAIAPGLVANLLAMHRGADAEREARAALEAYPDAALSHSTAMQVAFYRGRYADAEAQARQVIALDGPDAGMATVIARGVADPAARAAAVRAIKMYAVTWGLDHAAAAEWLAMLGARDSALLSLERFAAHGEGVNEGAVWAPAFDPVRNDPRFKSVLKKMGLPYTPPGHVAP